MKKPLIVVAVLIAVSLAAWYWWANNSANDSGRLVFYGNVDIRQISLAFDGSGRVASMQAEEGDRVQADGLLAVLDTSTLELHAEQARAQVAVQQQTVQRLQTGSRPEEIAQAKSRLSAVQADASRAEQDLARLQDIAARTDGRGVSAQELDRARTGVEVARSRVLEQKESLQLTELGPRAEELAGAEAQLRAAEAQLALLEHQIAEGELKAPANAVVRSRLLEPGDMATPQRPVYALALTHPKWVRIYVGEPQLSHIRPGMAARVTVDSQPDEPVAGTVGYISSVAEFTPKSVQTEELRTSLVYEVRVIVEDEDDVLRLGQPATVDLAAGNAQ